jgi:hypothetical protein
MSLDPANRGPAGPYPTKLNKRESKVVETALSEASSAAAQVSVQVAKSTISFADLVDGADVAFGAELPAGAIVAKCYGRVTTAFDADGDGSSTISVGLNANNDVQAAVAISGAPWSSTGMKAFKDGAAANMIILTEARRLKARLAILTTDTQLEDGSVDVYVEYVLPPQA